MENIHAKNKKLIKILLLVALGMFGFGFAMVPMYNVLCKTIGVNGKTNTVADKAANEIDYSREVTVEFLATNNAELPWDFKPSQTKMRMHPGEIKRATYFAKNNTKKRMTIQAIPSITPSQAAKYLKKTECFCFTQQSLQGGDSAELPMLFHVDPKLPKKINTITISYTVFDASKFAPIKKNKKMGRLG